VLKPCALFCRCVLLLALVSWGTLGRAQELTPRAYWPAPEGTNVLALGFQRSSGDVVTDPSLPISGVESETDFWQVSYQRTLELFGRTSNLHINLPYARGFTEGLVEGEYRSRHISAMADSRVRLSVNLRGAPTMDRDGLRELRANPRLIVGTSLLLQLPSGDYDPDKLINAGTNRWALKPALGVIWPVKPTLLIEFEIGAWIYGQNDNFQGQAREQEPILATELHLVKRIRPGFWASLDVNYYVGGRTTVDGIQQPDFQRNSRVGATLVFPFAERHALRASLSTGMLTESGGDFDSFSLSYLYAWH
jgi:hypothetical protein